MSLDRASVLERTRAFVRARCEGETTGHDWYHVDRVCRTALVIGREEGADLYVVELAALLHDVADWKFHDGDEEIGPHTAASWLRSLGVDEETVGHVRDIVRDLSFKGAGVPTPMRTREGDVVQDADRLDGIGAIGIARAFAYGGSRGLPLHDPEMEPFLAASVEAYKAHRGSTINHFPEKLLLLAGRMHTDAGRRIARERHAFMERFLEQFHAEWDGEA
jgi:uncharacterized protein